MLPPLDSVSLFNRYPDPSPEREYFRKLADLYRSLSIDLPATEAPGLGLMRALYDSKIVLHDGRVIGDERDVMGSIEDVARLVACAFGAISTDPIFWKSAFPSARSEEDDVLAAESAILAAIRMSPLVRDVT